MSNSTGQADRRDGDGSGRHGAQAEVVDDTFAEVLNGFTLDSGRKRRRRHKRGAAAANAASAGPAGSAGPAADPDPVAETVWPSEEPDVPDARDAQQQANDLDLFHPDAFSADDRYEDDFHGGHDDYGDPAAMVRPYQWTGGRTKASVHLELETLVSTSESGSEDGELRTLEHRTVASLCRHPHAVAEVAAKLSVPLGVARVLLSDMAEQGLITVHQTVADDDMAAHLVLMERVLSGLRRL